MIDVVIFHSTRGEEGYFIHHAGTPVRVGRTTLNVMEDSELEKVLDNLYKKLKK